MAQARSERRSRCTTVNFKKQRKIIITVRPNLTDLLGKNRNKKFNVTHQFQPFIAEEVSFHKMRRRLSTDVLKGRLSSSSVAQSSQ